MTTTTISIDFQKDIEQALIKFVGLKNFEKYIIINIYSDSVAKRVKIYKTLKVKGKEG